MIPGGPGPKPQKGNSGKWAYYPKLPNGKGPGPGRIGGGGKVIQRYTSAWIRVGSTRWRQLAARGVHPTQYRPANYNYHPGQRQPIAPGAHPGSGKGLPGRKDTGSGHTGGTKAGQKFVNKTPQSRGTNDRNNPGLHPPKPKTPKQQAAGGNNVARQIGGTSAGKMISTSEAGKIAQLQYGQQIAQAKAAVASTKGQNAQDMADIKNWYDTVMQKASGAQAADHAIDSGAAANTGNVVASILQAIGGGSNAGAGQVGAMGMAEANSQNQLDSINQQFWSNMQPMLSQAQAGASSAQQALNNQASLAANQNVSQLETARGDAQAQALMQIMQANNATTQQDFANRISKLQAVIGAQTAAGNSALQGLQMHMALQQAGQHNATGGTAWGNLSPGDQLKLAQNWTSGRTAPQAVAMAHAQGYQAPQVAQFLGTFYH